MRKSSCLIVFLIINFSLAQTKSSDYFSFSKDGEKYLKPIKYLLFDPILKNNSKTNSGSIIYFDIQGQRFAFDPKKHKTENCSISILKKIKLEDPLKLQDAAFVFFKRKKEEVLKAEKEELIVPPIGFNVFFKIYVLEKINDNEVVKYETDWTYSSF